MNLQLLKETVRLEVRKVVAWGRVALLAALPFAGDIYNAVSTRLPDLQPYLPENIYKFMGGAVVVLGMIISLAKSRRAAKASNEA